MSAYEWAWIVIAIAAIVSAIGLWFALGNAKRLLKVWLTGSALLLFCVPAPVPNYDQQMAPAFVVLVFEAVFQIDGQPLTAALLLLGCLVAWSLLALVLVIVRMVKSRRAVPPSSVPEVS